MKTIFAVALLVAVGMLSASAPQASTSPRRSCEGSCEYRQTHRATPAFSLACDESCNLTESEPADRSEMACGTSDDCMIDNKPVGDIAVSAPTEPAAEPRERN